MAPSFSVPPQWIVPGWPVAGRVRALCTTRHGGVSDGQYASFNVGVAVGDDPARVADNRARLRSLLPAEPLWLKQVHGTRVIDAAHIHPGVEADACITRTPGAVLAIQAADCMPVLLTDRNGSVVSAAHAGWRGLSAGVIENAVEAMNVAPADVVAWLGPAISGAAYEVGQDVHDAFTAQDPAAATAFVARGNESRGKYLVDLYALARQRLARLGVASVHGGGYCTYGEAERFYSYRREGVTGRMVALIWLEP